MMDPALKNLQTIAVASLDPIWYGFAKAGKESAVFAPMSKYPKASAWLARSMALTDDYIVRKLGAMLAGWIQYPPRAGLIANLLDRERIVFRNNSMYGNSVGEDIMFSATRWTESQNPEIKAAGIKVLSAMVKDALEGTPWNTANWAAANLFKATDGRHETLQALANGTDLQMKGQSALLKVAEAIRENNRQKLDRFFTAPSELCELAADDSDYQMAATLWKAAESAEAVID